MNRVKKRKLIQTIYDWAPTFIGILLSFVFYTYISNNVGYLFLFTSFGLMITIGHTLVKNRRFKDKELARKIVLLMALPVVLIVQVIIQKENIQLEGFIFYVLLLITTGFLSDVILHFLIAKLIGPFIWGRGFCGWICWTAAILEWLPIKENKKIPHKYTYYRYLSLLTTILIPFIFIIFGYDWIKIYSLETVEQNIQLGTNSALIWFFISSIIYYAFAIILAYKFKKKRAFCILLCPISLLMKIQTKYSIAKMRPSGRECLECGKCNRNCPMDVNVMDYIKNRKSINSSECIFCGNCDNVCINKAIK